MKAIIKSNYRIQNENRTFLNAGTGLESWFNLEYARKLVNYEIWQRIVECNGINILFEIF
jgi:hypothetical protein